MNNVLKLFLFLASILVFGLVFGISESFADEQEIRKIEGIYELKNPPLHPLETIFEIPYKITNATLDEIRIEYHNIVIEINSTDNGLLEADIPKNLHYVQRNEEPTRGHFIIIDGEEIFAEQIDNQCVISYSIPFAKGSRSIEILSSFTPDNTPIIPYKPPTNCLPKVIQDGLSPLKQIAKEILPKDVVCREKLELIFKSTTGSPACVKPETAEKLIERGWAHSQDPKQIDVHNNKTWGIGENLQVGDYFSYYLCHIKYKECSEITINLWFEEKVNEKWLVQVAVYDGANILRGEFEYENYQLLTNSKSEKIIPYLDILRNSVLTMSRFATSNEGEGLAGPKTFTEDSWGRYAKISGAQVSPTEIQDITVKAGTFESLLITFSPHAKINKVWIVDEIPFPVKADVWVETATPVQEYKFELRGMANTLENPFAPLIPTDGIQK